MQKIIPLVFLLYLFSAYVGADETLSAKVATMSEQFIQRSGTVGMSVAVMQDNKSILSQSFGYSDRHQKIPFSSSTVVALGSNAKVMTATAILQLAYKGLLELDDAIQTLLPELKLANSIQNNNVSVRHLLCHTSGLPNVFGEGEFEPYRWKKASSKQVLLNRFRSGKALSKPNEQYAYNNTGYLLLGWIVERVSGQSLGDYFRDNIFQPLGLANTYYLGDSFHIPNMSVGYQALNDSVIIVPFEDLIEYRVAAGAGGIGGTLAEYMRWFTAVAEGKYALNKGNSGKGESRKILSDKMHKAMLQPCVLNSGKQSPEGLGIEWNEVGGVMALNGGGVANGFLSLAYYFPSLKLTVGFVSNTETDWGEFHNQFFPTVVKHFK